MVYFLYTLAEENIHKSEILHFVPKFLVMKLFLYHLPFHLPLNPHKFEGRVLCHKSSLHAGPSYKACLPFHLHLHRHLTSQTYTTLLRLQKKIKGNKWPNKSSWLYSFTSKYSHFIPQIFFFLFSPPFNQTCCNDHSSTTTNVRSWNRLSNEAIQILKWGRGFTCSFLAYLNSSTCH